MNASPALLAPLALRSLRLPRPFPLRAAEPRLVCFGNEPSWSLRFDAPGQATLAFPDGKPVEYRGRETRLDFLKERAWRGTPAGDAKGVLVAFLGKRPAATPCPTPRIR